MAFLQLQGIGKIYVSEGNVTVGIRGVDLSFERGEFVAITGRSGSGKSTLLNVISGMDTYEEGELSIEGNPTSHYRQPDWEKYREKYVSFVFQDYTISDTRYHWKANNYKIRKLKGLREEITSGIVIDTLIQMEPMDLVFSKGQQETLTSSELWQYINKQTERGSSNVVQYEVEYHKRIATSFASFILTIIGASLSSRKRKGGMGLYLGIGLALSFTYILLQTVSSTFAINADTPPMLAAWIPNILYSFIAYFCYRQAPN